MKTPENVLKELKTSHRKYSGADHLQFHPGQLRQFFDVAAKWGKRELAMFVIGFAKGLRPSELANLRVSDIDLKNKTITIRRRYAGGTMQHVLDTFSAHDETFLLETYIEERAQDILRRQNAPSDVLFLSQKGGPLDRSQIFRNFAGICEEAGIPEQLRHPNMMRHTAYPKTVFRSGSRQRTRVALSRGVRWDVFERDNHTCQSCGRRSPAVQLELDHIIPICRGGLTVKENLQALCIDCNRGKSGKQPFADDLHLSM